MKKSSILAAISGNIIEWYDFTLYIFLAPIIAQNFFPEQNHLNALLSTFSIFALGFFIRPLGSLVFGHLGDSWGRAKTLKITMLLISLPTLMIGLLPTYHHQGILAGCGLVTCRLLQGLCIGGEFAGSMIYLSEMANPKKRAFTTCMTNNGSNLGVLCATLIAAFVSNIMPESAFYHYGWRIPFILGGLLGLLGLWLRRDLSETPVFEAIHLKRKSSTLPILTVMRSHKKTIAQIFLLLMMAAAGSYILMDFMSNYLHLYFHYSLANALKIQSIYNASTFLLVTLASTLSDRYGRRISLMVAAIGLMTLSIPCFYFLNLTGSAVFLLPLVIFYCLEEASTPVAMAEMFPANARYTGISIGYNLAMALVGGTAPLINTYLVALFGTPLVIAYYLAFCAALSLVVISFHLPKQFGLACDLSQ